MTHSHQDTMDRNDFGPYRGAALEADSDRDADRRARDERLQSIAWGLFLTMLGLLWILPAGLVPEESWLVGAGSILLGLNVARLLSWLETSSFTVVVGLISLGSGLSGIAGHELPLFPAFLAAVGLVTLARHLARRARARAWGSSSRPPCVTARRRPRR